MSDLTEEDRRWAALQYLLERLKEPSSWAGLALFFGFFGMDSDTIDRVTANLPAILATLSALAAIFAPSASRKALQEARQASAVAQEAYAASNAEVVAQRIQNSGDAAL